MAGAKMRWISWTWLAWAAAGGCGRGAAPPAPDAVAALPLPALVEVTAQAECARLRAGEPQGALEPYLRQVLGEKHLERPGYDEAARLHPEATRLVDEKIRDCRVAAGYVARPSDAGGVLWEKLPP